MALVTHDVLIKGYLYKRGDFDTQTCTQGEHHVKINLEIRLMPPQTKEPTWLASHQELGKRQKQICPHSLQKEPTLLPPGLWISVLQTRDNTCLLRSHPVWVFLTATLGHSCTLLFWIPLLFTPNTAAWGIKSEDSLTAFSY